VKGAGAAALGAALAVALAGTLGACGGGGRSPANEKARANPLPFDYARRVGMVEGDRPDSLWLMIADSTLSPGDSLTLISDDPEPDPGSPPSILSAAVAERLRRFPNKDMIAEPGDVFYRLVAPPRALDCCIFGYAVRRPHAAIRVVGGRPEADLDHDGVPECFQSCTGLHQLYPTIWSGDPLRGTVRWTRRFELNYDVEPNCPPPGIPSTTR
jgi:hypothetical protein